MDNDWDSGKLLAADLPKQVVRIHLTAYENPKNKGDGGLPPANHWTMLLELPQARSVRIDMAPGFGSDGLRGKIVISSESCASGIIKTCIFPATVGVTVQNFVDLISSAGRQKYRFTPEWEGGRFWNLTVMKDLQSAGYIPPGCAEESEKALSMYWIFPAGSERRRVEMGTFGA